MAILYNPMPVITNYIQVISTERGYPHGLIYCFKNFNKITEDDSGNNLMKIKVFE